MKVYLRHFNINDLDFISQKLYPHTPKDEIVAMIRDWDTLTYKGSYFETLAIEADSKLSGYVSLYEREKKSLSVGAIIIPELQNRGIAFEALTEAFCRAKESGYLKVSARVRKDNKPSLRLCEKLGLLIFDDDTAADGKAVYKLEKTL